MEELEAKNDMKKNLIERELENVGVVCFREKTNYKPS